MVGVNVHYHGIDAVLFGWVVKATLDVDAPLVALDAHGPADGGGEDIPVDVLVDVCAGGVGKAAGACEDVLGKLARYDRARPGEGIGERAEKGVRGRLIGDEPAHLHRADIVRVLKKNG